MFEVKIFSDFHHAGLYASFIHLFETRLGNEIYRPIGKEWFDEGYWMVAKPYGNDAGTIDQYLKESTIPSDGTPPLNDTSFNGMKDHAHGVTHKTMTLDEFKQADIDIVIASIPDHIPVYKKLIKDYKPDAKFIYHIGNIGWHNEIPWDMVDNLMASVKAFPVPDNKRAVFYRQEFDVFPFNNPDKVTRVEQKITSFVNCLPEPEKLEALRTSLPDFKIEAYGAASSDGVITGIESIANIMRSSKFGYHNKPGGDGFGHVIHNWFAAGVPIIVNMDDYKDKLAGELLEDGMTCIDMSDGNMKRIAGIVREMTDGEYLKMCENVREVFTNTVDFRRDAISVDKFLKELV